MDFMRIGIFLAVLFVAYVGWRLLNPFVFSGMARALGAHKMTPLPSADMRPARTDAAPLARVATAGRPAAAPAAAAAGGIDRRAVEAVGGDWEPVAKVNGVLAGLAALRQPRVARDPAARGRVAWKVAVFRQAALYRLVALAAAAGACWNGRQVFGAALSARALLESVALLQEFDRALQRLLEAGDLAGIDALVMAASFASPVDAIGAAGAVRGADTASVLAAIDAAEAPDGESARAHYDALAGLCEAGALGQYRVFGEFDKAGTAVVFSADAGFELGLFGHVLGGVRMLVPAEATLRAIEAKLAQIAALEQPAA